MNNINNETNETIETLTLRNKPNESVRELSAKSHRTSLARYAKETFTLEQIADVVPLPHMVDGYKQAVESTSPSFKPVAQVLELIEQFDVEDYKDWKENEYSTGNSSNSNSSRTSNKQLLNRLGAIEQTLSELARRLRANGLELE